MKSGLNVKIKLLPEYLKDLGYDTHIIGKWHLGYCNEAYLPTRRGFNSHYGYWLGAEDYFEHTQTYGVRNITGYDFRENDNVDQSSKGKYSAQLFADRAIDIIRKSTVKASPFFLYLAFQNPHAPLQVPEHYKTPYEHIKNEKRKTYCGMVSALDEAVGNVTKALKMWNMADNTLIVFTSDNGGQNFKGGSNYPLRGGKKTLWEGGTRGVSFIHGSMLLTPGSVSNALIHVTDWLPTLFSAAGGDPGLINNADGVDQWDILVNGNKESKRHTMLYNIDPIRNNAAIRYKNFKLMVGEPGPTIARETNGWDPSYRNMSDEMPTKSDMEFDERSILLFDLEFDPSEKNNLFASNINNSDVREVADKLFGLLISHRKNMVYPPINSTIDDQNGNPSKYGNNWSTGWCDLDP